MLIGAVMRVACLRRSLFSLAVVPPLLLLIPSPEANERCKWNFPPFYYRCSNGQTLVSRLEHKDQFESGETFSVYPYPVEERSQVLWKSPEAQSIAAGGQQYDCKPLSSSNWEIPDPSALRDYAQRFKASYYSCGGDHTAILRITDFFALGYRHGVMQVDDQEQLGLYFSRGTSGSFNHRGIRVPGLSLDWGVHTDDDDKAVIRWFLNVDDKTFTCIRGRY